MNDVTFKWDEEKNLMNHRKHKIWFREAATVFDDEKAKYISDVEHSDNEERFIVIGLSDFPRLLMVCHCYRESESVIRIISARKANRKETEFYGGER